MTTWPVSWKLASTDRTFVADLMAGAAIALDGTITCAGRNYSVSGGWSGAHTIVGRNYSVFALSGRTETQPDVPNWISVVGMMTGPGEALEKIDIRVTVSSSADGTLLQYSAVLYSDAMLSMLDTFDHVVVLMLENRSFDNLLGYMYPNGVPADAPLGKTFEGVVGKDLSNPHPYQPGDPRVVPPIPVSPVSVGANGLKANYFQPYPDPGETYDHVNTQFFNGYPLVTSMKGFVNDYFANYQIEMPGHIPTYDEYAQIMQCYTPEQVPVITKLAEQFGVFDHWFCAVPSQTWCNRAFWNAGTSWGHVNNGGYMSEAQPWFADSVGPTIFSQIQLSHSQIFGGPLNWKVYADSPTASLTHLIHFGNPRRFSTCRRIIQLVSEIISRSNETTILQTKAILTA